MIINILWKRSYIGKLTETFKYSDLNSDFISFDSKLHESDLITNFDFILYTILLLVAPNTIIDWLIDDSGWLRHFLEKMRNGKILFLYAITVIVLSIFSFLRLYLDGAYLTDVHEFFYSFHRNLLVIIDGYFVNNEANKVHNITENNTELSASTSLI